MRTIWAIFRFVAVLAALLFPQLASAGVPAPKAETRLRAIDMVVETSLKATSLCEAEARSAEAERALEVASRSPIGPRGGAGRLGAHSPVPESYMNPKHIVEMEPARGLPGSTLNASGEVRNANYFWRQLLERDQAMFSKGNRYRIEVLEQSPKVDSTWIKHNPTHAKFNRDVLHHHHIDHGPQAVPLPETVHQKWTSALHPKNK